MICPHFREMNVMQHKDRFTQGLFLLSAAIVISGCSNQVSSPNAPPQAKPQSAAAPTHVPVPTQDIAAHAAESTSADFENHEHRVFSQQGEDGIIERLFEFIEPTHRYAVEFGAGDGLEFSNTRNLVLNRGWSAFMIEGDDGFARRLAHRYRDIPRVKTKQAWIFPGNIEQLLEDGGVPRDLDLISIDIDSNDYYVWRAIVNYRPKVVLIEFNGSFPPPQKMVVNFHPMTYWDGSDYYGASIQSMYELGKRKGYELVYCENNGVNLFFVDRGYYERFGIDDNSPIKLYKPPLYGPLQGGRAPNGRGHAQMMDDIVIDKFRIKKVFNFDR